MSDSTLRGYARCSTDRQDLAAQIGMLTALGVAEDRIYSDHGYTGTKRERPGLDQALAAVREGDTLVVTKLDRLGRSLQDLLAVAADLERRGVRLQVGSTIHDPADPMGRLLFQVLGMVAEFEAAIIRQRTREGMAVAKARGRLKGKQPSTTPAQEKAMAAMLDSGDQNAAEVASMFGVSRATVYRARERHQAREAAVNRAVAVPI